MRRNAFTSERQFKRRSLIKQFKRRSLIHNMFNAFSSHFLGLFFKKYKRIL